MNKKVVIGSRESKLAVLQSQMVKDYIVCRHPQMDVEILTMKTTGDKILDRTLDRRKRPFCKGTGSGAFRGQKSAFCS